MQESGRVLSKTLGLLRALYEKYALEPGVFVKAGLKR